MINNAFVNIWNMRVGAIACNPNTGLGTFQYDQSFLKTGINLSPFLMPIENGDILYEFPEIRNRLTFKGLPGLLADILPDKYGNALINTWLASKGRTDYPLLFDTNYQPKKHLMLLPIFNLHSE